MEMITNAQIPYFQGVFSDKAKAFLQKLLVKDPRERLGFGPNGIEDIKADPFFESIDWQALYEKRLPIP